MRHHWLAAIIAFLAATGSAPATPYWIAWEGDDLPENQGWTRNWGNWDGQYQGPGAYRTLADGVLTYDSLYDDGVFDYSLMNRPGQLDPESPGEVFQMEWRLNVLEVDGSYDPDVALRSDDAWAVGLLFSEDRIYSIFEGFLWIPITPHVFHDYRLLSADMRTYQLFIDGVLAREGAFVHKFVQSYVAWGDSVQGAASLHEWDYFRYGVTVPEPVALALMLTLVACGVSRRR